jgi:ABC-type sugar transport system ATPase subunit
MSLAQVELRRVSKVYPNGVEAVSELDLRVDEGAWLVVVGPSGSGKSTLLRLVAGLETPNAGSVWIGGECVDGLSPHQRDLAMVFQTPALYPHLSVFDNLAFGLRARRMPRAEIRSRVASVAEPLELTGLLDRTPRTLSGGQRQRAALGRALARRPRVLLLDEPLSSLDAPLRASLREILIDWRRRHGTTAIHVTHDQDEALAMGHQVAVMNLGRLVQVGTPEQVYRDPVNRFVARFVGSPPMNLIPCEVKDDAPSLRIRPEGASWEDAWQIPIQGSRASFLSGATEAIPILIGLRAEHITLATNGADGPRTGPFHVLNRAELLRQEPHGHETIATFIIGTHPVSVRLASDPERRLGPRATLMIDLGRATWFEPRLGIALRPGVPGSGIAVDDPTG